MNHESDRKATIKAISIREPWASLILTGKKTIETRTWKTSYRGPLLLCAAKKPNYTEVVPGWITQSSMIAGTAFAICNLVNVRPMTFEDQKLACVYIYDCIGFVAASYAACTGSMAA